MLAIQYACNAKAVKIPWDVVQVVMGDEHTKGSIVQHLAKTRQRMIEASLAVPPPLRRGGIMPIRPLAVYPSEASSAISKDKKRKASAYDDDIDGNKDYGSSSKKGIGSRKKGDTNVKIEPVDLYDISEKEVILKRQKKTRPKKAAKTKPIDKKGTQSEESHKPVAKKPSHKKYESDEDYEEKIVVNSKPSIVRKGKSTINYAKLNGGDSSGAESNYGLSL